MNDDNKSMMITVEVDGKKYTGDVYMASVYDGNLTISVKGSVPISFPVTEVKE